MDYVSVESKGRGAYDVTEILRGYVREKGLENGLLLVSVTDPLTSLITIEYEARLIADLGEYIDKLPGDNPYVKNSLFPKTLALPVVNGDLELGSFQQVALLDLNEEPGERRLALIVVR